MKLYLSLLFYLLLCPGIRDSLYAKELSPGMEAGENNFTTLYKRQPADNLALWRRLNAPEYHTHPEFGMLPAGAPNDNCIEIYSKRRADRRFFRDATDTSIYYSQQTLGDINTLKDGAWQTIEHRLEEVGYRIYRSVNYKEPVIFNLNNNDLAIHTTAGSVSFNNWLLLAKNGTQEQLLAKADLRDYTVGEDGMYVRNIFNGIDATFIVYRGAVKTNFIIKSMQYGQHDMLIFKDAFSGPGRTKLEFSGDPSRTYGKGQVTVFSNESDVLHINEAVGYVKGLDKSAMISLQYQLSDNTLGILVPGQWIADHAGHEIIIDPLVTGTATLGQNAIAGSRYGATCFSNFCAYNLNVNVPAAATITDVTSAFTYIATGGCWRSEGATSFQVGNCRSPSNAGFYWYCANFSGGTCGGNDVSIMNDISGCLPPPSCASWTLPVQMRFYRCYGSGNSCSNTCIGAASPWTITVTGRTVEFQNPGNNITFSAATVCQGQAVTATAGTVLPGVPPYTYSWSLSPTGMPVAATGSPANITFDNAGNNTVYLTVSDACNNTLNAQRDITVIPKIAPVFNPAPPLCAGAAPPALPPISNNGIAGTWNPAIVNNTATTTYIFTPNAGQCADTASMTIAVNPVLTATESITICAGQLPYNWNGITVNNGGNNAATFTTASAVTGCDSTTTLNLTVNPVVTATQNTTICASQLPYMWNGIVVNNGGNNAATFTTASAVTGCDSTTTLNLTVNPLLTATQNITICASQLPYTWNGILVNNGGNNAATFTAASAVTGCDSTTTLNLTVNPLLMTTESITICASQLPYNWNGIVVNNGGNNAATFTAASAVTGCDSTTTLNLTVNPVVTATQNTTICASQLPYTWNCITVNNGGNNAASFTTASAVTGCDSTTTLNLTVNPLLTGIESITICTSQLPYMWNGITVNNSGNNAATFTTASTVTGCDSVTTLNLAVNPALMATENITVCASQLPYMWNGITVNNGGNNAATFTTASAVTGCDSTTTLNLTVNPLLTATQNTTICASQLPYTWNGIVVNNGGNNAATFTTASAVTGCDSTTTLNLTVNPLLTATESITIFASQLPYNWNGITVNNGGNNAATFTAASAVTGCDSTTTLNLTVNPVVTATQNITICASQLPYMWNGITVNNGGNNAATFTAASAVTGCDSTTTLNLTVNSALTAVENITICTSQLPYNWNGIVVNNGGNNAATFTTASAVTGCDSTTTLNLTVNPLLTATESITICASQLPYNWNGITVNNGGNNAATFTMPAMNTGCDSTTVLNLTVNPLLNANVEVTICSSQLPYTWNGIAVNTGGNNAASFTTASAVTGCDSTTHLNLTVNPVFTKQLDTTLCSHQTPYIFGGQLLGQSGNYTHTFTTVAGCDSVVNLALTVIPPPVTAMPMTIAGCDSVVFEGRSYGKSTVLQDTFYNVNNCDSLYRTIRVEVTKSTDTEVTAEICRGETYRFDGDIYTDGGTYIKTYTGNGGCDSVRRLTLTVHPLPLLTIQIAEDPLVCVDDTLQMAGAGADYYYWWVNDRAVSQFNPANIPLPSNKNIIKLKGETNFRCTDSTSILVTAEDCCGIGVPNAFSPNGDGLNDAFGAIAAGHPRSYKLQIYDRWGKKIFISYSIYNRWDGTFNGARCDIGNYFYTVQSQCTDGSLFQKKGEVILIR